MFDRNDEAQSNRLATVSAGERRNWTLGIYDEAW